eukprot:2283194-Rhodomonas_salina.1
MGLIRGAQARPPTWRSRLTRRYRAPTARLLQSCYGVSGTELRTRYELSGTELRCCYETSGLAP